MNSNEKFSESGIFSVKGPKLGNNSLKILNINKNLEYQGNRENSFVISNSNNEMLLDKSSINSQNCLDLSHSPTKVNSQNIKGFR